MICVRKEDLRLGMFVQSLEGSWFNHPFWRSKFLLEEMDDLRALQSSDIDSVWVDEEKSLAPAIAHLTGGAAPAAAEAEAEVELSPIEKLRAELAPAAPVKLADAAKPKRVAVGNEFQAAAGVLKDCKAAVGELFARIQNGEGEQAIEDAAPVVSGIAESVERNPDALITLLRVRSLDEYTYMHSIAVSALMINLARQLQLPPDYVKQAGTAGLFMDVGKAFLPPELLSKRGAYSDADRAEMQRHAQLGSDAVKASGDLSKMVADVCLHHHERFDGTGYPHRLKGDDISLFARMAAICDTYDALASERPHRPARGPADAVADMYKLKGYFDESVLTNFIRSIGIYPVGSLVRLESRMLGCVSAQRRDELTKPVVRVFYSIPQGAHVPVHELDLAEVPSPDRIVAREEPGRWGLADWDSFALTILQGQKAKRAA
ncbi:MAG: HDIG domain protein [uncultured Sphingosinicella sp.]|uniref:HDIG domain protein n=1 Tax=uncultured Sphingosinicella sp. TaxID=478748 RepID=A0A6J4TAR8_9SPHN|nr:HD-GYP domain-containing protein [uncultured Sphingosinicella sp.]CAA9518382.1 MAG: HDIG domain protein [uncultured Sphingosinicella sp.]